MKKIIFGLLILLALSISTFAQERGDSIRLYADGIHDDTEALQLWNDGVPVWDKNFEKMYGDVISNKTFLISGKLNLSDKTKTIRFCNFVMKYPYRYPVAFNSFWKIKHHSNEYFWENRFGREIRIRRF